MESKIIPRPILKTLEAGLILHALTSRPRLPRVVAKFYVLWHLLATRWGRILVASLTLWKLYARFVTRLHRQSPHLRSLVAKAEAKRVETSEAKLRVAIIGCGISGVQALKACLAEAIEPVCFESESDVGGFWRYKEDEEKHSVYRSTHIDTPREQNAYGDFPYSTTKPVFLHNTQIHRYLYDNVEAFGLRQYIRFNTKVNWVTPHLKDHKGKWSWRVTTTTKVGDTERVDTDVYDGVLVCSGRHGGSGYIPAIEGLDRFQGQWLHSNQYKYPEKHQINGRRVVVVGIGNSGLDIVTEVCRKASKTTLVSRSGAWIFKMPHGEVFHSTLVQDRLAGTLVSRVPWWTASAIMEHTVFPQQHILNKHGMKPKHRALQQHLLVTGFADPNHTLHAELERGTISVKKEIKRFTENGVVFVDKDGKDVYEDVDVVVFATGYKQAVEFLDPRVVDMRFEREGNDVPLYKHMFPINEYNTLAFINFLQAATFICAELQTRLFTRVLKDEVVLPPVSTQQTETELTRQTFCAQYIDRQQLRVQTGLTLKYYDDLARLIGCYPSFWKLLTERPTALWHAWLTDFQAAHYRLVGHGRLENAEKWIESLHYEQYWSHYKLVNPGQLKPGPRNRQGILGVIRGVGAIGGLLTLVAFSWLRGYNTGGRLWDQLYQNVKYAQNDTNPHSIVIGEDSRDVRRLREERVQRDDGHGDESEELTHV